MKPLTPGTPHAIIMVGIPGSGKTTFAERFAETFQAPFIDDNKIAATAQSGDLAELLSGMMFREITKTKRTLLFEGATHSRANRTRLAKEFKEKGYTPIFVWVQTDSKEARRRATKKNGLSDDAFDTALKHFTAPTQQEKPIVLSGKHTYASQLKIVLKRIADDQRPQDTPPTPQRSERPQRPVILR